MFNGVLKWLMNYLKGNDIILEDIKSKIDNLAEGKDMLATSIQKSKQHWVEYGMQQGVQQGVQQGMQQGMQQGVSRAIIETLEVRFGTIPYLLKEKITYCDDLKKLNLAHKNALLISSLDKFKL